MGVITASAALLLGAGSAVAAPVYVGMSTFTDSYGTVGGGEFLATYGGLSITPVSLGVVAGSFETFCMEEYESIPFGSPLKIDTNDRTVASASNPEYNGVNATHGGIQDPLSNATAWLYKQFITQALAGFDYGAGAARVESSNQLQIAIWALEEERPAPAQGQAKVWYNDALASGFVNDGSIVVLNVYGQPDGGQRTEAQDVLAYIVVPLPTSVAAGLAMIGGLGFIRRRRA